MEIGYTTNLILRKKVLTMKLKKSMKKKNPLFWEPNNNVFSFLHIKVSENFNSLLMMMMIIVKDKDLTTLKNTITTMISPSLSKLIMVIYVKEKSFMWNHPKLWFFTHSIISSNQINWSHYFSPHCTNILKCHRVGVQLCMSMSIKHRLIGWMPIKWYCRLRLKKLGES